MTTTKEASLTWQEPDEPKSDLSVSSVCSKDATAFSLDDVQSLRVLGEQGVTRGAQGSGRWASKARGWALGRPETSRH